MKLLTKENRKALPKLDESGSKGLIARVKFFTPDAGYTWYACEFDQEDEFFGLIHCYGNPHEFGYFKLSDLKEHRGNFGLPIERDKWFNPAPIEEVKRNILGG